MQKILQLQIYNNYDLTPLIQAKFSCVLLVTPPARYVEGGVGVYKVQPVFERLE